MIQIDYPRQLHCTLVHPEVEIRTADSRKVLPTKVYLKDAVKQWGTVAGLVAGLMKGDFDLIGRSLEDHLIEPVRSMLIPGFHEVRDAAFQEGVLGCSISGSGPSMFALSKSREWGSIHWTSSSAKRMGLRDDDSTISDAIDSSSRDRRSPLD